MMGTVSRMKIVSATAKHRLSCRRARMVVLVVSKSLEVSCRDSHADGSSVLRLVGAWSVGG